MLHYQLLWHTVTEDCSTKVICLKKQVCGHCSAQRLSAFGLHHLISSVRISSRAAHVHRQHIILQSLHNARGDSDIYFFKTQFVLSSAAHRGNCLQSSCHSLLVFPAECFDDGNVTSHFGTSAYGCELFESIIRSTTSPQRDMTEGSCCCVRLRIWHAGKKGFAWFRTCLCRLRHAKAKKLSEIARAAHAPKPADLSP